jgi:hypothetical protein
MLSMLQIDYSLHLEKTFEIKVKLLKEKKLDQLNLA